MWQEALVIAVTGVLIFCVFSIVRVLFKPKPQKKEVQETMYDVPDVSSFEKPERPVDLPPAIPAREHIKQVPEVEPAPVREPIDEEITTPVIPGQTEEEVAAPEPLQMKVSQKVEEPEPRDTHAPSDNIALFGSNLRHPESMISKSSSQFASLEEEVSAGVASKVTRPKDVDQVPFSAEMAQNGGEFMSGIFAFDTSDSGGTFSEW